MNRNIILIILLLLIAGIAFYTWKNKKRSIHEHGKDRV